LSRHWFFKEVHRSDAEDAVKREIADCRVMLRSEHVAALW